MSGILEGAQETWAMAELGTRSTIERVDVGHSLPKAARACALLGGPWAKVVAAVSLRRAG